MMLKAEGPIEYQPFNLNDPAQEPVWIISVGPGNDAADAAMRKAKAAGTTQALSDTVLRKHYRAIEKRRDKEAKANG